MSRTTAAERRAVACAARFRERFAASLVREYLRQFGYVLLVEWSIFSMTYISRREDMGRIDTQWINGFETAWLAAQAMEVDASR